jgi:crotonobetainyl-CoA:carnitine CoA-transferase CaiB-like acyl-CoA transferase
MRRRLLDAIGKSELIQKEEYATNVRRLKHMKEIDDIIETWTADRSQQSIEDRMRDAGVPCSAVQTVEEVIHDPHLEQRHMVEEIDHPAMEEPIRVPGTPIRLSDSELPDIEPSPTKGQDNYEVLTERLGLSEDEIQELEEDGII